MGNVYMHKNLHSGGSVCGGGWFLEHPNIKKFIFYGESFDFGRAKKEDIQAALEKGNYSMDGNIYEFEYDCFYGYELGCDYELIHKI